MIKVFIPQDLIFQEFKYLLKSMYENSQEKIGDSNSFDFITKNTFFYGFYSENGLIGAIYYFIDDEDKLFLNGYAGRGHFFENVECLKMSLNWFNSDIYSQAQNRASALCLLKAGFKRDNCNIFIFKHNI